MKLQVNLTIKTQGSTFSAYANDKPLINSNLTAIVPFVERALSALAETYYAQDVSGATVNVELPLAYKLTAVTAFAIENRFICEPIFDDVKFNNANLII